MNSVNIPEVLWAQRANHVYVTINVPDVESPSLDLKATSLTFSGVSHGKRYAVELPFFKEIDVEVLVYIHFF